jgi:hypothetical protein
MMVGSRYRTAFDGLSTVDRRTCRSILHAQYEIKITEQNNCPEVHSKCICEISDAVLWLESLHLLLQWLALLDTIASRYWDPSHHETLTWEEMKVSYLANRHVSQIPRHQLEKKLEVRISEDINAYIYFLSFFFQKGDGPASAALHRYINLIHNELIKIIHPKNPKLPHNTYTPDHERKTCQQGLIPGRHTKPSCTRNRKTSHTPRPTKWSGSAHPC